DCLQILADLRAAGKSVPVLVLTARDGVTDRVTGLDAGADDYQVKPFAVAELLARVRALLRRGQPERETALRSDDLAMDLLARRVTGSGEGGRLTQGEFEVLESRLRPGGRAVTREMLGGDVWREPDHALTNVIDAYISLLRRKLERPGQGPLLHTVRGVG